MKKLFKIFLLVSIVSAGTLLSNESKSQTSVSFSVFYSSLKPYGRWVSHSGYGQVWISNTSGFIPYSSGGHWAYTNYGWTWVSDYDWGWAPFHYGRWAYERSYGWFWVPGYEWAPAWVAWRGGGDYYGWAPLSPGLNINVGISYGNSIPYDRWVFAPHQYITSSNISRYYVPRSRNITIIKNTTIVNNVTVKNNVRYAGGPKREDVERINHARVNTYTVANSSRPGKTVINNNTVNVYRPVINNNNDKTVNKVTVNKNSNNTTVNNKHNHNTIERNSNNKNVSVTKNSDNNKKVNKKKYKQTNETSVTETNRLSGFKNNQTDKEASENNYAKINKQQLNASAAPGTDAIKQHARREQKVSIKKSHEETTKNGRKNKS